MKRLKMLERALEYACEQVHSSSSLGSAEYEELVALGDDDRAVKVLAKRLLEGAVDDFEMSG